MLASLNWLREYVEITDTPEVLADKLTRAGTPVEFITYLGEGLNGVVTGKVVEIKHHPDADKLWVCSIDTGSGELVQILTGAQNVVQGAVVPVAVVGSELPNGMKLKKAKMRGLESFGMLCSASELGLDAKLLLPSQRDGILLLAEDTPIGLDIKDVLGLNDVIFDFDLTANRGDCFNMLGLAREVAAITGARLNLPDFTVREEAEGSAESMAMVEIQDSALCSRFSARVLKDIEIKESPAWMQKRLRACGIRPISNVVDVTNYVMLELGQPMHAYDYDKVAGHKLIARRAVTGETLLTLDGQERKLNESMIVISDNEKAVGLGGVMGGLVTEVTAATKNVLLEAASFDGVTIRRTSRLLGLRSEASGRFERGVDTQLSFNALNRAAFLLEGMAACKTVPGIVDAYPVSREPQSINVCPQSINRRLGTDIPGKEMAATLGKLGFEVSEQTDGLRIVVPTWRTDVTCEADISEEIVRMAGLDNIEAHLPCLAVTQGGQGIVEEVQELVRDFMAAAGFSEVINYSFIHPSSFDKIGLSREDGRRQAIEIMNPITEEFKVMRTTLLPGMLAAASYNIARQNNRVAIFEVGRAYRSEQLPLKEFPVEKPMLCAVMSGRRNELNWNEQRDAIDFYDVKGVVEGLVTRLQLKDCKFVPGRSPYLHPGKSCELEVNGVAIGCFGELHPAVHASYGIGQSVYVFELEIEPLVESVKYVPQYRQLPKFPGTFRDIAVVVPDEVIMSDLMEVIEKNAGSLLQKAQAFDVYTGKQVAEGFKSIAFNLTFQAQDRTLTDEEIDKVIKHVIDSVSAAFAARLRE